MPELWAEFWTRPGHVNFGRVIDETPSPEFTFHDGIDVVGDGTHQIAESFTRFDEILNIDVNTPANSESSLCRIFSEADPTTPVFEWLPNLILPTTDKEDPNVDVSGLGIKSILAHARAEAFDWDGTDDFEPTFPDWIWGGRNLLRNPGFEDNLTVQQRYELWNDATGGTFTLDAGGPPTAAIAYNVSASALETAIETLAAITDVRVEGDGTESAPWFILFADPSFGITLTCDGALLTGDTEGCVLDETEEGGLDPRPWTKSQRIDRGVAGFFGTYASDGFRLTTGAEPVLSGDFALRVNGLTQFAGAQQVIDVTPGTTGQIKVPLYTSDAADSFRVVVRSVTEELLATSVWPGSVTGNVGGWDETTFVIPDVVIPDSETTVIVRIAYVGTGNPSPFYLDDIEFLEGLAATHPGGIFTTLYDDAVSNHPGRIVWEDEANPGTPYLTLDFGALDSAGQAWVDQALSLKIWMRMTYLQVMEQIATTWGYEWRIVPDDTEAGTWQLQVYNPGTMKTDYTAAATPAIQGGASDVRRSIRRFLPSGTDLMVEGEQRITSRDRDPDLVTALGRIESSRIDRELPTSEAVIAAAFEDVTNAVVSGLSYVYELVDPQDEPLSAYVLGDLLTIHDPPEVTDEARLVDVVVVATPFQTVYQTEWAPATTEGS